jgi:glycosyltransferase involved in cell wall biosynthesis
VVVGVPVRDGGALLELALKTLTGQTHSNLEIIISDNASTDRTPEICEQFAYLNAPASFAPRGPP